MLLSIIIPCYNSEKFISNTLDMLIAQGLDDTEIIAINDGSTDNTFEILKDYSEKYEKIRIFSQENQGVSVARNMGIEKSIGKYIYFMDSDDTLTDGTLDYYRANIRNNVNIDLFAFGYKTQRNGKTERCYVASKTGIFSNEEMQKMFFLKEISMNICSVLFNAKQLYKNSIRFIEGHKIGEDLEFIITYLLLCGNCSYDSRIGFIYQLREDSATTGYKRYNHHNSLDYQIMLIEKYGKNTLVKYYNYWLCYFYIGRLYSYLKKSNDDKYWDYYIERKKILNRPYKCKFPFCIIYFIIRVFSLNFIRRIVGGKL